MHRPAVGLIALVLLSGAAACYLFGGDEALKAAFWRVGVIMALLWLALPELMHVRGKFVWGLLALAIGLMILRPKLAPVVLLFCVVYAVLRPRSKPRP